MAVVVAARMRTVPSAAGTAAKELTVVRSRAPAGADTASAAVAVAVAPPRRSSRRRRRSGFRPRCSNI